MSDKPNGRGTTVTVQLGTLTLGKIKEPFVYEMVGDAANLPHHERLMSPFFRSRNDGVTLGTGRYAVQYGPALLDAYEAIGLDQRSTHVLFNQNDCHAVAPCHGQQFVDLVDGHWRQAQGHLVA